MAYQLALELLGEFSQHLHSFQAETHFPRAVGLLQANQTQEYSQEGPACNWKIDLLQRLNLLVYDGVRGVLRKLNHSRNKMLSRPQKR